LPGVNFMGIISGWWGSACRINDFTPRTNSAQRR
jgi:hypothetical protein